MCCRCNQQCCRRECERESRRECGRDRRSQRDRAVERAIGELGRIPCREVSCSTRCCCR